MNLFPTGPAFHFENAIQSHVSDEQQDPLAVQEHFEKRKHSYLHLQAKKVYNYFMLNLFKRFPVDVG